MGEDEFLGEYVHSSDGFAWIGVEEAEGIGDFHAGTVEVVFGGEFRLVALVLPTEVAHLHELFQEEDAMLLAWLHEQPTVVHAEELLEYPHHRLGEGGDAQLLVGLGNACFHRAVVVGVLCMECLQHVVVVEDVAQTDTAIDEVAQGVLQDVDSVELMGWHRDGASSFGQLRHAGHVFHLHGSEPALHSPVGNGVEGEGREEVDFDFHVVEDVEIHVVVLHFLWFFVFPDVVEDFLFRSAHPDVDVARQAVEGLVVECCHALPLEDDGLESCVGEVLADFHALGVHEAVAVFYLSDFREDDEPHVERRTLLGWQEVDAVEQHAHHVLLL